MRYLQPRSEPKKGTIVKDETRNILIGGEAGQGLATINDILCKALVRHGYFIIVTQDYMSRVRGGHNTFAIRVGRDEPVAPKESYDLLIALNKETVELHREELHDDSLIIADSKLAVEGGNCLSVPFENLSEREFSNVAGLGILASILGLDWEILRTAVSDSFKGKSAEIIRKNEEALEKAFAWATANAHYPLLKLESPKERVKRLLINGNQAIALGALAAGIKFYSFYPMTPATSIGVALASYMDTYPLVVEQAEDEIAAMNMAIGASFAGVPAMVGTSGGGFALMTEAISLVGASETPVVVVVAQRPGPATGLPTRTEQADLFLVLHAGHGEFPRAILAPANPRQCFHMTRKAFDLAETSQGPVFVLSDQFLSDYYQAVEPFDISGQKPVKPGTDPDTVESVYKRYRFTENGVSPRLIPGKSTHLVVGDSHEHSEDGHITEDKVIRKQMVEKRLKKMEMLNREVIEPEFLGDDNPTILLVCWGSTRGSAIEAGNMLRKRGKKAAVLHFLQVWPLVPEGFMKYFETAQEIVFVESNATAQFARLVRRETGIEIGKTVLRYDGRPITPEYILRTLDEA